jgi:acyl carrier protein
LQGALKDKVSVMTMINRDDILIDRNIEDYGLDSLVSVELRNWIRREFGAELALTAIVGSGNLKGLSEKILSLMPAKA